MVITEAAGQHLVELLDRSGADEHLAVRLVVEDDDWDMCLDRASPDDETFDHAGRTVLLLDPQLAILLEDVTLEVRDTTRGRSLVMVGS